MNKDEYISQYGSEWAKFKSTDAGVALLRLIDDQHPVRGFISQPEGMRLQGAPVLLNSAIGYELLQSMLKEIGTIAPEKPDDDDDSFSEPPKF